MEVRKFLKIKGIHHVSSIVGDAQNNLDFYTKVMGLRLLKQTLNYDDKESYHLYYGNKNGSKGIVTTFPMNNAVQGKLGDGQVAAVSLAVGSGSLDLWKQRLKDFGFDSFEYSLFNKSRLRFNDPDGLEIEFVENETENHNLWTAGEVDENLAFRGIHSASLYSKAPKKTLDLLRNIFGYEIVNENEQFYQLKVNDDLGGILELSKELHDYGQIAQGTVHHLALGVEDEDIEMWRTSLIEAGFKVTEVKNRNYFKSLYFRDSGGILFELATQGPGVTIDENINNLGNNFIVPKHFEEHREEIIENMTPLKINS